MFLPRRRNRRRIAVTERSFADLFSTFFESDEIRDRSLIERVSVIKIDARRQRSQKASSLLSQHLLLARLSDRLPRLPRFPMRCSIIAKLRFLFADCNAYFILLKKCGFNER